MSDRGKTTFRGLWVDRRGPFSERGGPRLGRAGALIWLGFIVFPVVNAVAQKESALSHALVIAGAAAFVAAYIGLVLQWRMRRDASRLALLLFAALLVIATALTVADRPGWGFLFTYCAACTALIAPAPLGLAGVGVCVAFAAIASLIGGASAGTVVGFIASAAGIGLLMTLFRDLRLRNEELSEARAELARLAVAEERERFARDLHDLLGHTLSVIALKAELAGRLLPERPADAATEVADVESVARKALGEVREAVSGYRQPTLDGELEGARMALAAAGIDASVQRPAVSLDPATEAVLAWAVREGATNVIRHSGARHCELRLKAGLDGTTLEIVDDGVGSPSSNGGSSSSGGGHGLAGLAERVQGVHGRVESGVRSGGGFRLAVQVPRAVPTP